MKYDFTPLKIIALSWLRRTCKLIVLLVLVSSVSSCINVGKHQNYDVPVRQSTFLKYAYISSDKIYIKQVDTDKEYLFSTSLRAIEENNRDDRVAADNIIRIDKVDNGLEDELRNDPSYTKIEALPRKVWEEFIDPLVSELINNLVPMEANQGILLSINSREMVVYRNAALELDYSFLFDKPPQVNIITSYTTEEYNSMIFYAIKNSKRIMRYALHDIIFFESSNDALDYPFGIIDLKNERILYFDYSASYDFNHKVRSLTATVSLASSMVLKSHLFAIIKNPFTSAFNLGFIATNKVSKILWDGKVKVYDDIQPLNTTGETMDIQAFDQLLDKKLGNLVYRGKVEFLIGGEDFFARLVQEIQNAKSSIKIRLYIFDNDDYGSMIADKLKEASKLRDVKVKVLMDSYANITKSVQLPELPFRKNFKTPSSIKMYLRAGQSGVQVKTSANTWLTFDHVKSLIFDDAVVFTGGMNIGQEYRYSWHDLMARLEGPVALAFDNEFNNAWARNDFFGDAAVLVDKLRAKSDTEIQNMTDYPDYDQMANIRLLFTKPGRRDIFKAQKLAIQQAKKYIYIQNPYLADKRVIEELIQARRRGVDVRIILPAKNNILLMAKNNKYLTNMFLQNQIRVFFYPGMTHVKAAIYDGWAVIGSANFDSLSFDTNRELSIAFSDPQLVERLKTELFEKDFAISTEMQQLLETNWTDRAFSGIANQL